MKKSYIGNLVDPVGKIIFHGEIIVNEGRIEKISKIEGSGSGFIMPGFVDAHVHVESSMSTPLAFSAEAVKHGTIAAVADPHEIANVLGTDGVKYMLASAEHTPFKFLFGVPSCVPATSFETSGARLESTEVEKLLELEKVGFLAEVMNYPGVINGEADLLKKISLARGKAYPVDGHAPGLRGKELEAYASKGITTDHECFEIEEAREKIRNGMNILIREGSGAKNFTALVPLLNEAPEHVMFCTDDSHPDDLLLGHINVLVKRAVQEGYELFDVLRAASVNPVRHYNLNVGLLQVGDPADFIIVRDLENFHVLETVINGDPVYLNNESLIPPKIEDLPNIFISEKIQPSQLEIQALSSTINLINIIDGELITRRTQATIIPVNGKAVSDPESDLLKLAVINRYKSTPPALAFIHGLGLRKGAIATSVAHDSHNIIAAGVNDDDLLLAINWIIDNRGGMVVVEEGKAEGLALPVAGIMSDRPLSETAARYKHLSGKIKAMGSELKAPFMTLSFMALLVIPEIKLSDKGLFDGNSFSFIPLFV